MLRVLHEDAELLVIDKPAWSVVHRTRGADMALVLVDELRSQLGYRVFPVHRLDCQTSGVLVLARSREAAALLSADIREDLWQKRYLGLCRGVVKDTVIVDHPVRDGSHRRSARTEFEPRESFCGRYTLLAAVPRTGRRHQLRYHLKHISHPLVGDVIYGQGPINRFFRERFDLHRMFLHAERLTILRPGRAATLELHAPLGPELEGVLAALRVHDGPVA